MRKEISKNLNFGERFFVRESGVVIRDEMVKWDVAKRVVRHVESDGSASLGSAAGLVELEAYEGFDQRALTVRLVSYD